MSQLNLCPKCGKFQYACVCTKPTVFRTYIGLKNEDERTILERVASDISKKDFSFTYKIKDSTLPQYKFLLIIYSATFDLSMKRGYWMVTKPFGITKANNKDLPIKFWVKPKKTELSKNSQILSGKAIEK